MSVPVSTLEMSTVSAPSVDGGITSGDQPIHSRRKKGTKRAITLAVVLIAVVTSSYLVPVKTWLHESDRIRHAVLSLGIWAYPSATLAIALLIAVGVPRLLLCTICGMVLGLWPGLCIGEIGTVLSTTVCFFLFVTAGASGRCIVGRS
jgi:uncharacterized membrane protein YdjX (TVP38/TMEM64 family)